jgi:hypothetical protein
MIRTTSEITLQQPGTKTGGLRTALLLSLSLSVVAACLLILKFAPAPFFWLWLTLAAVLWAAILGVHGSWPRAILFNLGIVACLLAAVEGYLILHEYIPPTYLSPLFIPDEVLGWAPIKSHQAHAIKANPAGLFHHPIGLLFDTRYTIDSIGLRVAPPYRKDDLAGTALFFGCSFTFGEGLQDNETLPYQVGDQSGGRYRTFNFSFQGYSPAQMLAAIEHGMVRRLVDTTPRYAFYVAIPTHVWRVAGRVAWADHTPRYVLDGDGMVSQEGHFENREELGLRLGLGYDSRLRGQLVKSAMWRILPMRDAPIDDYDIRLYFGVVRRAQEILTTQYPNIQFRIILYPAIIGEPDRPTYEKLRDGFRQMGIPLDLVEDILPNYKRDRSEFILSSRDPHPSALANRLLAKYVLSKIGR